MTYDQWKDPTDYSPDDDSDWASLVETFEGWEDLNSLTRNLAASSTTPKIRPFYGAECPNYPNCSGGCGLGCTHEIEASRAPVPRS